MGDKVNRRIVWKASCGLGVELKKETNMCVGLFKVEKLLKCNINFLLPFLKLRSYKNVTNITVHHQIKTLTLDQDSTWHSHIVIYILSYIVSYYIIYILIYVFLSTNVYNRMKY